MLKTRGPQKCLLAQNSVKFPSKMGQIRHNLGLFMMSYIAEPKCTLINSSSKIPYMSDITYFVATLAARVETSGVVSLGSSRSLVVRTGDHLLCHCCQAGREWVGVN